MDYLVITFLCLVVIYADLRITRHNMNVQWNGLGSVAPVCAGKSLVPMQYRVLVPWLWKVCGATDAAYLIIRQVSIVFALFSAYLFFGNLLHTTILGMFFVLAALYDYTDVYIEVGLFALAFTMLGSMWLIPITLLATLNRETAVFIPITAFCSGHIQLSLLALFFGWSIGYFLPRLIYGPKKRYCGLSMVKRNIETIVNTYKHSKQILLNEYTHFIILLSIVIYAFIATTPTPIQFSMGLMFVSLLIPTMWREIRVFAPCMLGLIPMVIR